MIGLTDSRKDTVSINIEFVCGWTAAIDGFTKKYSIHILVWYEVHETMESAIAREKEIKDLRRQMKIDMIEAVNPYWNDLYKDIL